MYSFKIDQSPKMKMSKLLSPQQIDRKKFENLKTDDQN